MPWKKNQATKYNNSATGKKGKQWAAVANAVLQKTGDEGRAIQIASGVIKKGKKHGHAS